MADHQHTIKKEVSIRGRGLHTDRPVRLRLRPARPGSGVTFIRSDLPGRPRIPARIEYLSGVERGTSLSHGGGEVRTVEHLLAALAGAEIDNLEAELDGPECPVGDGSALPFLNELRQAGTARQEAPRSYLSLPRPIYLLEGESILLALPADRLRVAYTINFAGFREATQYLDLTITRESFSRDLAAARTFGFLRDALPLLARGLIRGTGLENTVVIGDGAIFSSGGLRFPDEFVRHKILDLLGDLFLLGRPLRALLLAVKAGHSTHTAFIRKLKEVEDE